MSALPLVLVVLGVAVAGCGSSSPGTGSPGAGADAGTNDGGHGGSCTTPLADTAPTIVATCDANAQQTATGGAIVEGTYFASSDVVLASAPCSSSYVPSTTLQIANGVFAFSFAPAPGIGNEQQQWSYVTSGSQVTLTLLCDTDPNGSVGTVVVAGYSILVSQLTLYFPSCCGGSYSGENVSFSPM